VVVVVLLLLLLLFLLLTLLLLLFFFVVVVVGGVGVGVVVMIAWLKIAPAAGREVFYGGVGLLVRKLQVESCWYRRSHRIN
jgi:hypothetical protein